MKTQEDVQNEMQELADKLDFDLKKLPYGFQFRIGKLILSYYNTAKTAVICKPKQAQKVKKHVPFEGIESILVDLKSNISDINLISGQQAFECLTKGIKVNHKRLGESEWRKTDISNLAVIRFLDGTFLFEIKK